MISSDRDRDDATNAPQPGIDAGLRGGHVPGDPWDAGFDADAGNGAADDAAWGGDSAPADTALHDDDAELVLTRDVDAAELLDLESADLDEDGQPFVTLVREAAFEEPALLDVSELDADAAANVAHDASAAAALIEPARLDETAAAASIGILGEGEAAAEADSDEMATLAGADAMLAAAMGLSGRQPGSRAAWQHEPTEPASDIAAAREWANHEEQAEASEPHADLAIGSTDDSESLEPASPSRARVFAEKGIAAARRVRKSTTKFFRAAHWATSGLLARRRVPVAVAQGPADSREPADDSLVWSRDGNADLIAHSEAEDSASPPVFSTPSHGEGADTPTVPPRRPIPVIAADDDAFDPGDDADTFAAPSPWTPESDADADPDLLGYASAEDAELEPAGASAPRNDGGGGAWTIPMLCAGIALIACCLIIPQADANRRMAYEKEKLRRDLENVRHQVAVNDEFLRRVHEDPGLAERLAQRQMKSIRAGTSVLPISREPGSPAAEMSPFALVAVDPPEPLPAYQPRGGVLARWCYNPRSRLYLIGAGLTLMAAGLVLGSVSKW